MCASDTTWQDAWLLLAVKYAVGTGQPVKRDIVIQAGDFINHAIFTEEEIEHGIEVLESMNLLEVIGGEFRLGNAFAAFWECSGAEMHRSVHKQLERVKEALNVT